MIFNGLEPWPENYPTVECETPTGIIDLHNWGSLKAFEFRLPETLIFHFEFDETWGGSRGGTVSRTIHIRFDGVTDLTVGVEPMVEISEADSLADIVHATVRPGRSAVRVKMLDGLRIEFEAGSVTLEE